MESRHLIAYVLLFGLVLVLGFALNAVTRRPRARWQARREFERRRRERRLAGSAASGQGTRAAHLQIPSDGPK